MVKIYMKTINTVFTERQFLSRLDQNCILKSRFSHYMSYLPFVYKINDRQFWLGKFDPTIGKTGGFWHTRLNCKYNTTPNGRVSVSYRRTYHPSHLIFIAIALVIWLYYFIASLINLFSDFQIYELLIALAFLIVGLLFFIIKPYKEWSSLESHLHKICGIE